MGLEWLSSARVKPLAGDASNRRYWRLRGVHGERAVRAVYPPGSEQRLARDVAAFRWLRDRGIHVPKVLDVAVHPPSILLEDLGAEDAEQTLRSTPEAQRPARTLVLVAPLVPLAGLEPEALPPWNRPLDRARLEEELEDFATWALGRWLDRPPTRATRSWLRDLAAELASHPRRICHRDYHLNNLFFLPGGSVGVIDAQDVLVGPDTYDAASFLGERALPELIPEEARRAWAERWAEATAAEPGWEVRLEGTTLQRGLKVLGTFARLSLAGKGGYRRWMGPLAERLLAPARRFRAPSKLLENLLDFSTDGGSYVR